jgi:hypothetical protein
MELPVLVSDDVDVSSGTYTEQIISLDLSRDLGTLDTRAVEVLLPDHIDLHVRAINGHHLQEMGTLSSLRILLLKSIGNDECVSLCGHLESHPFLLLWNLDGLILDILGLSVDVQNSEYSFVVADTVSINSLEIIADTTLHWNISLRPEVRHLLIDSEGLRIHQSHRCPTFSPKRILVLLSVSERSVLLKVVYLLSNSS